MLVSGAVADKPSRLVAVSDPVIVATDRPRFVSRAGEKLWAALEAFAVDATDRRCLDAGASTGGFTDCLLRRGARSVVAVDVGYGQLASTLAGDPRVEVRDRTNVRDLTLADTGGVPFELVVADLSFISLATVAARLAADLAQPGAAVIVLVKPQFEAGRAAADKGRGVVRDPAVRRAALGRVASAFEAAGAAIMGAMASPLLGPAGNAEFFLHVRAGARSDHGSKDLPPGATTEAALDAAVRAAPDAG